MHSDRVWIHWIRKLSHREYQYDIILPSFCSCHQPRRIVGTAVLNSYPPKNWWVYPSPRNYMHTYILTLSLDMMSCHG